MYIEQKHSKKLSKRIQRDRNFQNIIYSSLKNFEDIEPGIKKVRCLKDIESIFSSLTDFDSDYQFNELIESSNEIQTERIKIMKINYQQKNEEKTKERLKNCKWNNKKLFLIALPISRLPNPIKFVRLCEYSLPLDSDIFTQFKDKNTREHVACHSQSDTKRVVSVTYDSDKKLYTAKYQEKVSLDQELFHSAQQSYYIDFLTSLGNNKAMYMVEIVKKIKAKRKNMRISSYYDLAKSNGPNEQIILKSFDNKLRDQIKFLPCLTRLTRISTNNPKLEKGSIKEEFNMPFLELMGYTEQNKDEIYRDLLNSKIQTSLYTKDTFEIIKGTFETSDLDKNVNNWESIQFHSGFETLRDKYGNDTLEFQVKKLQENWIENDSHYKKSYLILSNIRYLIN